MGQWVLTCIVSFTCLVGIPTHAFTIRKALQRYVTTFLQDFFKGIMDDVSMTVNDLFLIPVYMSYLPALVCALQSESKRMTGVIRIGYAELVDLKILYFLLPCTLACSMVNI